MSESELPAVFKSPLQSIRNFRDIGNVINAVTQSRVLNSNIFYRSARPDEANPNDRNALISVYNVHAIIDLRSDTELIEQAKKWNARVQSSPLAVSSGEKPEDAIKIPGIRYININLNGGAYTRALAWQLGWVSFIKCLGLMAAGYRTQGVSILAREVLEPKGLIGLATDSLKYSTAEFKEIFEALADQANYPVMLHCTQGKDRTGLVVILVLMLLEIPVDAIKADYIASERELEVEKEERLHELRTILLSEAFSKCPDHYVPYVVNHINEVYGGARQYLKGCGVTAETLDLLIGLLKTP